MTRSRTDRWKMLTASGAVLAAAVWMGGGSAARAFEPPVRGERPVQRVRGERPRPPHPPEFGGESDPGRPGARGPRRGFGPGGPMGVLLELLGPQPLDRGPLGPGETDLLLDFADSRLPRLARRLREARDRAPERFERRFARDFAPLLRSLQRVYLADAELGDKYRRHAETMLALRHLRGGYQDTAEDGPGRVQIEREVRRLFAEQVTLERELVARRIAELEAAATQPADTRVAQLLSPDAEPLAERPPIRRIMILYQRATDEVVRANLREELRRRVEREREFELRALRRMDARLTDDAEAEVDRRWERFRFGPPALPRGDHLDDPAENEMDSPVWDDEP